MQTLPRLFTLAFESTRMFQKVRQVIFDVTTLHRGLLHIMRITTFGCYQQLPVIFSTSTLRPLLLELVFIADIVLGHYFPIMPYMHSKSKKKPHDKQLIHLECSVSMVKSQTLALPL